MFVPAYIIFISSPSDVIEERVLVDDVFKDINHIWSDTFNISFRSKKWEDDVFSRISNKNPNEIILEEIGDCDIYLGIMWKRFGTSNGDYDSGTEQEFRFVLNNFKKYNKPLIKFYFCKKRIEPDDLDIEQLKLVKNFEKELKNLGIVKNYESSEEFKYILFKELSKYLMDEIKNMRNKNG